jgi:hypothetical protein
VLEAFDRIDPLRCGGGMPDEYLGYAKRFVEELPKAQLTSNKPKESKLFTEMVRRCFTANQIVEGWVSCLSIETIASDIYKGMQRAGLDLDASKRL